jgi:hypothetical protein
MSILDEMVFCPERLTPLKPIKQRLDLSVTLAGNQGGRATTLQGPWLVSSTLPTHTGANWQELCGQLNERGLLLECTLASLDKIPVTTVPRRIYSQLVGRSLDFENLHTADVVELKCYSGDNSWGWPPEIEKAEFLCDWLAAVRRVIGVHTPLGLGVCAGVDDAALQLMLALGLDFISIYQQDSLELLVDTLARIGRMKQLAESQKIPIVVRGEFNRTDDLVKLLALGAQLITIDGYLAELWTQTRALSGSYLNSHLPSMATNTTSSLIEQRLSSLDNSLAKVMTNAGANSLAELKARLIGLTDRAQKIAINGIRLS